MPSSGQYLPAKLQRLTYAQLEQLATDVLAEMERRHDLVWETMSQAERDEYNSPDSGGMDLSSYMDRIERVTPGGHVLIVEPK